MKAICVTLGDPEASHTPWLTLHREYLVLAILALPGRSIKFRVLSDDGRTPILADSSLFAAPVQPLPGTWAATVTEDGVVELGPEQWLESGFWDRYFDRDPAALQAFQTELRTILGDPPD